MGLKIPLIPAGGQYPAFAIDCSQYMLPVAPKSAFNQALRHSREIIVIVGHVLAAVAVAFYQTMLASPRFFKEICLQHTNGCIIWRFIPNLRVIAFNIAFFVGQTFFFFVSQTVENFSKKREAYSPAHAELQTYMEQADNTGINLAHLAVPKERVDISHIPPDVTVARLDDLFLKINVDNPQAAGYVRPYDDESRKEYTKEAIKQGIEKFVKRLSNPNPSNGGVDPLTEPRNRVLFAIDWIETRIKECHQIHGNDPTAYQEEALRMHQNILEDAGRLIVDCAVVALDTRCETRIGNVTLNIYHNARQSVDSQGTLKESLQKILIEERRKVINEVIYNLTREKPFPDGFWFGGAVPVERMFLRDSQDHGADTHLVMSFLLHYGTMLGIPDEVQDPYAISMNRSYCLINFFKLYTPNRIIEAVNLARKESQAFRNQLRAWLLDQRGEWQPLDAQIEEPNPEWQQILDRQQVSEKGLKHLERLKAFVLFLKEQNIVPPNGLQFNDWNGWLEEACVQQRVKDWLLASEPPDPQLPADQLRWLIAQRKSGMKSLFEGDQLGSDLFQAVKAALLSDGNFAVDSFLPRLLEAEKITQLSQNTGMDPGLTGLIVKGQRNLRDAYINHQERELVQGGFLQALGQHADFENGLTPEMMEWLLVDQRILLPQQIGDVHG